ncbi:hypothetical protein MGAS9429_Spy1777 [Streptococcus pyogenes MGAS9429]|uniref:Uncharacterized protein n=1 Tax=Streptococcus pyogenes serotype M12 (strain MGAS9429) TaxID=370551 RepID=Q1JJK9_STRPC|nr:hypothetical protein MGAS9429_Spy1777 [Streptococcus pyogenes MGAS9429]
MAIVFFIPNNQAIKDIFGKFDRLLTDFISFFLFFYPVAKNKNLDLTTFSRS